MSSVIAHTLISTLFIITTESALISTARFYPANTGIDGFISTYNGVTWFDLDFSAVNWTAFPTNCSKDGLSYHIHTKWTYNDFEPQNADRTLDACHADYTGGHYDPWFACGGHTGAADCELNGGCIAGSTIYGDSNMEGDYICTTDDYDTVSYTCEVGDWSGKYGVIKIPDDGKVNATFGSFWETNVDILNPVPNNGNNPAIYSIVMHCTSGGERAFCAPILRETLSATPPFPLTGDQTIETNFNGAGDEFNNFTVKWTSEGMTVNIPASAKTLCDDYYVRLYEKWAGTATAGKNCDVSNFGGIFDPTHTCITDSGSPYCSDGIRCEGTSNTTVSYSCTAGSNVIDRSNVGCAIGDVSARIGTVKSSQNGQQIDDPMSPPLFALGNRAIVFSCTDNTSLTNICALTQQTNGTIVTLEPFETTAADHVNILYYKLNLSFIVFIIVTFYSF